MSKVRDPGRMDDTDFLHHVLSDGEWHRQMDILAESGRVRGCGMTVHSRASTLRDRGFVVVNRQHVENGRRISEYRLLGTVRPAGGDRAAEPDGSSPADRTAPRHPAVQPPTDGCEGSPPVGPGFLPIDSGRPLTQLTVWESAA